MLTKLLRRAAEWGADVLRWVLRLESPSQAFIQPIDPAMLTRARRNYDDLMVGLAFDSLDREPGTDTAHGCIDGR